jgi:hypothetical protein
LLLQVVRWVFGMNGPGVRKTPHGIFIAGSQSSTPPPSPERRNIFARPTGNRNCGGSYSAVLVTNNSSEFNTGASSFSASDIGTDGTDEITLVNLQEQGKTTHALTAGTPVCTRYAAWPAGRIDSGGKAVYYTNGIDLKACT